MKKIKDVKRKYVQTYRKAAAQILFPVFLKMTIKQKQICCREGKTRGIKKKIPCIMERLK